MSPFVRQIPTPPLVGRQGDSLFRAQALTGLSVFVAVPLVTTLKCWLARAFFETMRTVLQLQPLFVVSHIHQRISEVASLIASLLREADTTRCPESRLN